MTVTMALANQIAKRVGMNLKHYEEQVWLVGREAGMNGFQCLFRLYAYSPPTLNNTVLNITCLSTLLWAQFAISIHNILMVFTRVCGVTTWLSNELSEP